MQGCPGIARSGPDAKGDSFCDALAFIQPQQKDGDAANGGQAGDAPCYEAEVLGPVMLPGVKERRERAGLGIERAEIRALVPVAREAGEGQVVQYGLSTVLQRDDVIDLVGEEGDLRLQA